MKIAKMSYSMTRQISQFNPGSYSIEAEITEGDSPEQVAIELQRFVIKVLYKDNIKTRDELIKLLITDAVKPAGQALHDSVTAEPAPSVKLPKASHDFLKKLDDLDLDLPF